MDSANASQVIQLTPTINTQDSPWQELAFWGHGVFILVAASIGFYLPLSVVMLLVFLHRVHTITFKGCLISKLQRYLGVLPQDKTFFQVVSVRFFDKTISRHQSILIDCTIASIPLVVALIKVV
jgi:hypothetical protein